MDLKDIQALIKMVSKASLSEFKLKKQDFEISIRSQSYSKPSSETFIAASPAPQMHVAATAAPDSGSTSPAPSAEDSSSNEGLIEIKSPIVGTFYRSSSPDKPPFLKVGDTVSTGDVVCIVEAMKLFNEIESEVSGKIVQVCVEDASPVEYDQILFLVDPKG